STPESPLPEQSANGPMRRPDIPLEPGAGKPRSPSNGDQVVRSDSRSVEPEATPRAEFIAAARRAAQVAANGRADGPAPQVDSRSAKTMGPVAMRKSLGQRMRSFFGGAGLILATAGLFGVGSGYLALEKWAAGDTRWLHARNTAAAGNEAKL